MSPRVLVLDNDAGILKTVGRFLAAAHVEAVCISHPGQVVDALKEGPFSHAVIDVDLDDGIDGISIAGDVLILRPGLHVVIMSGDSSHEHRASAAGLPFLAKPFGQEELLALLRGNS